MLPFEASQVRGARAGCVHHPHVVREIAVTVAELQSRFHDHDPGLTRLESDRAVIGWIRREYWSLLQQDADPATGLDDRRAAHARLFPGELLTCISKPAVRKVPYAST